MIGDIFLFIRQTFCIHEYLRKSINISTWKVCKKCGRVKL